MAERYNSLTNAAVGPSLRDVFGRHRHAAKTVAHIFGISISAAKLWLATGVPAARRDEADAVIDLELAAQHATIWDMRRRHAAARTASGGAANAEHHQAAAATAGGRAHPASRAEVAALLGLAKTMNDLARRL